MKHWIIIMYASIIEAVKKVLILTPTTAKWMFIPGFHALRIFNSKALAYHEFVKAKSRVPAYQAFLKSKEFSSPTFHGFVPNIEEIPSMDKENYIKQYSIDARCVDGHIPDKGVVLDESSGSSGQPSHWVRGTEERVRNGRMIGLGLQNLVGTDPVFIINAFALGPWATGVNVTMSCVQYAKLKSLGPDKSKIENTLQQFGTEHRYVIMGYPPFLKSLVDSANIDWKKYDIVFIFGGEPMAEGMRAYLLKKGIKKVFSSLGASDLELNISAENDFTISLRQMLQSNQALQTKLLKHTGALPMLFQYNPADFLIESTEEGELLITICRSGYVAPKIRYNIHDKGHVLSIQDLYIALDELGIDRNLLFKPKTDLPILFHYGRADMTVSFFGSNISPTDVQEVIYDIPELSCLVNSFSLTTQEDHEGSKELLVCFESQENKGFQGIDVAHIKKTFFDRLAAINQDFRAAKCMIPSDSALHIRFEKFGAGWFKGNDVRIKAKYVG